MLEITSSTENAIRTIETRVSSFKITSFQGKNVSIACYQIRSAITRLRFLKTLPSDLTAKLLTVFQTSSVAAFNDIFRFLDLQRKIGSLVLTPANLINLANSSYRELVEKGEWNGNKKGEALVSFSDKNGGGGCSGSHSHGGGGDSYNNNNNNNNTNGDGGNIP